MRTILTSAIALSVLYLSLGAECRATPQSVSEKHSTVSNPETLDLPSSGRRSQPKLSLERALKIAKIQVEKEKINISSYWLYEAHFILYGDKKLDDKEKLSCWHFSWLNNLDGRALDIVVSMDGKAMLLPSL